jgi:hypothetical protein
LHKQTIFPQCNLTDEKNKNSGSEKSTSESGPYFTPINKKYNWYPNLSLTSPMKKGLQAESPAPKSIKSYHKHSQV